MFNTNTCCSSAHDALVENGAEGILEGTGECLDKCCRCNGIHVSNRIPFALDGIVHSEVRAVGAILLRCVQSKAAYCHRCEQREQGIASLRELCCGVRRVRRYPAESGICSPRSLTRHGRLFESSGSSYTGCGFLVEDGGEQRVSACERTPPFLPPPFPASVSPFPCLHLSCFNCSLRSMLCSCAPNGLVREWNGEVSFDRGVAQLPHLRWPLPLPPDLPQGVSREEGGCGGEFLDPVDCVLVRGRYNVVVVPDGTQQCLRSAAKEVSAAIGLGALVIAVVLRSASENR